MKDSDKIIEKTREGFIEYLSEGYSNYLEGEMLRALGRISDLSAELKTDIWNSKIESTMLLNVKLYKEARSRMSAFCLDDGDYNREAIQRVFNSSIETIKKEEEQ